MILRTVICSLNTLTDICKQAEVSELWISLQRTHIFLERYQHFRSTCCLHLQCRRFLQTTATYLLNYTVPCPIIWLSCNAVNILWGKNPEFKHLLTSSAVFFSSVSTDKKWTLNCKATDLHDHHKHRRKQFLGHLAVKECVYGNPPCWSSTPACSWIQLSAVNSDNTLILCLWQVQTKFDPWPWAKNSMHSDLIKPFPSI